MDSGNSSGSMQSSSGGDEEYDSIRGQPNVAAFLNPSAAHFGSVSNRQQPHQRPQLPSHLYDPSPIFGGAAFSQSPSIPIPSSSFLNLDAFRSGGLRSRPDCSDLGNNFPAGSSTSLPSASSSSSQLILAAHQGSSKGPLSSAAQLQSVHDDDNGARGSQPSDQTHHHQGVAPRNPKKRTRASRRAPTTVLTTDTSNFRAMVQEFTGIPAPPFSGSPYSRRLDPFGPAGSGLRSGHLEPLGSIYPLRPLAQKLHHHQQSPILSPPHSFLNKNNMVDAAGIAITTANNNNTIRSTGTGVITTTSSSNPSSINYQLASDLVGSSLPNKQPQNMIINMQNHQMFPFQSLIQTQSFQSSFNVPAAAGNLGAKSTAASNLPLPPSFEELGMSHGHVNTNLNGLPSHHVNMWRDHGSEQDHQLRPFDLNPQRANNYSSSSASLSDFHHDKGLENASARGEGAVDLWICPSAE